jgi:protein-tyrosine phosphatase
MDEALEAARAAVAAGVTVLAATPHVRHDHPTTAERMERGLGELRAALARESIPLDLRGGGELDIEWMRTLEPDELRRFGLAGNPGYVLVEIPYSGWPLGLRELVFELALAHVTPVFAHPELNPEVQDSPERLRELVDAGALVQVTASSLDGRYGSRPQQTALALLGADLVHLVASDSHGARLRGFDLSGAVAKFDHEALARWLVHDVPAAIADKTPIPPRPHVLRARRGLLARLRGR